MSVEKFETQHNLINNFLSFLDDKTVVAISNYPSTVEQIILAGI